MHFWWQMLLTPDCVYAVYQSHFYFISSRSQITIPGTDMTFFKVIFTAFDCVIVSFLLTTVSLSLIVLLALTFERIYSFITSDFSCARVLLSSHRIVAFISSTMFRVNVLEMGGSFLVLIVCNLLGLCVTIVWIGVVSSLVVPTIGVSAFWPTVRA